VNRTVTREGHPMSAIAERLPTPAAAPARGRAAHLDPDLGDPGLPDPTLVDHWVLFHGVPWAEYERLLAVRGDCAVPRLTYLDGELELMSPSIHHEVWKKSLARLVEDYARLRDIELEGYGSWTLKNRRRKRGAEADECYALGPLTTTPKRPDFAIEVVWTGGGIDKLEVWHGIGVPEVWIFRAGRLAFFERQNQGYREVPRSRYLPDLDPRLVEECMAAPSQNAALRLLRKRLGPAGAGGA
jgi:Uma2 family endonuclease